MSHFCTIKTKIVEKEQLKKALTELGYNYQENTEVKDYNGNRQKVEISIPNGKSSIGFRLKDSSYELVADWYGGKVKEKEFINSVTQKYARNQIAEKVYQQGYLLVDEEVQEDQSILLTVRQW